MYQKDQYEEFVSEMQLTYPNMFKNPYGGFDIGSGWWHIVKSLCHDIQSYIDHRNKQHELLSKENPYNLKIPDIVPQVIVVQIKEKFGGLRFYYNGGNDVIDGMVRVAESWASHTCETCGNSGKLRVGQGRWVRTLCDVHEEEYQRSKSV